LRPFVAKAARAGKFAGLAGAAVTDFLAVTEQCVVAFGIVLTGAAALALFVADQAYARR